MENRFWNKTVILGTAGILTNIIALVFFFIPQTGDDGLSQLIWSSPQGIAVIILVTINIILFVVGIIMKEKHLSLRDRQALVERRQDTLGRLENALHTRLEALRPLIVKAGGMD